MAESSIVLSEGLKILLAVLCLIILIALGYKLYQAVTQNTELAQAREHLETIEGIINNLDHGESYEYLLTGPKGWYFVGYNRGVLEKYSDLAMPLTCTKQSCLCICPKPSANPAIILTNNKITENLAKYIFYLSSDKTYSFYSNLNESYVTIAYSSFLSSSYYGLETCQKKGACVSFDQNISVDSKLAITNGYGTFTDYFPWVLIGSDNSKSASSILIKQDDYNNKYVISSND